MIQPLSNHVGLLQSSQLSSLGGAEKPGEAEHDGDSDDGGAGGSAVKATAMSPLSSFMGTKVNTLA
ncbi:MAG TPA: hypothetical protein VMW69_06305 [Spirochaetia bacterium]|nr:hypothetical protein [Spirochaetia bacterium]